MLGGPLLGPLRVPLSIGHNDLVWSLDLHSCYFGLSEPITLLVGSFVPFISSWASLAHFLILHSHEVLLTLLGFFGPITLSFILGAHGLSINPLLGQPLTFLLHYLRLAVTHSYFSTSHNVHRFTTSLSGLL